MTAIEHVEERIERLKQGFSSPQGWKLVLDDTRDICTWHDTHGIQMKCKHLSLALHDALQDMGAGHTWEQCCQDAITNMSNFKELNHVTSPRAIMTWHMQFRANDECFLNPKFHTRNGEAALPPLLEQNPELKQSLVLQQATSNLDALSAELLLAWLHDIALPALLKERGQELVKPTLAMAESLKDCRLTGCKFLVSNTSRVKSAATWMVTRNLKQGRAEKSLSKGALKMRN
jgi:hypothetical protein